MSNWQPFREILDGIAQQGYINSLAIPSSPGVYQIRIVAKVFQAGVERFGPRPVIHIGSAEDLQGRIESFLAGALGLHVYHSSALRMICVRSALSILPNDLEFCFQQTSNKAKLDQERRLKREFEKDLSTDEHAHLHRVRAVVFKYLPPRNKYPITASLPIVVAK